MSKISDADRLRHMLDAAEQAIGFSADRTREDFHQDRQLLFAVTRCIEIIGEAATLVTAGTKSKHNEIEWTGAVAMRNRIIHGYFDVDPGVIWATVQNDLPPLIEAILRIIPPEMA